MSLPLVSTEELYACSPFPTCQVKIVRRGMLAEVEQKSELTRLTLLAPRKGDTLAAGSTVWVRGDACKQSWAMCIYTCDDVSFILVPKDQVVAVTPVG